MKLIKTDLEYQFALEETHNFFRNLVPPQDVIEGSAYWEEEPFFSGGEHPFGMSDIQIDSFEHKLHAFFKETSLNLAFDFGKDTTRKFGFFRIILRAATLSVKPASRIPFIFGNKILEVQYLFTETSVARSIYHNGLAQGFFPDEDWVSACPAVTSLCGLLQDRFEDPSSSFEMSEYVERMTSFW